MKKNIIAKMHCESVTPYDNGKEKQSENVTLRAVYGDSEENKTFAEATPSAEVRMSISNPAAWGAFEQGKEYIVTFALAEKPEGN